MVVRSKATLKQVHDRWIDAIGQGTKVSIILSGADPTRELQAVWSEFIGWMLGALDEGVAQTWWRVPMKTRLQLYEGKGWSFDTYRERVEEILQLSAESMAAQAKETDWN